MKSWEDHLLGSRSWNTNYSLWCIQWCSPMVYLLKAPLTVRSKKCHQKRMKQCCCYVGWHTSRNPHRWWWPGCEGERNCGGVRYSTAWILIWAVDGRGVAHRINGGGPIGCDLLAHLPTQMQQWLLEVHSLMNVTQATLLQTYSHLDLLEVWEVDVVKKEVYPQDGMIICFHKS